MQWITSHIYITLTLGVMLVLLGVFTVKNIATNPQEPRTITWSGGGFLLDPSVEIESGAENSRENIYAEIRGGPPFYYDPNVSAPSFGNPGPEFDFDAFIVALSQPSGTTRNAVGSDASQSAYSFIPSGLISTSIPQETQTPTQEAIRAYGNSAGSIIQTFEPILRTSPQVLQDQFADRNNSEKSAALVALAESLGKVGSDMMVMENIPAEVASAHMSVAQSYQDMGEKLARVAHASGEQGALDAILTYNASVETYIENYVALATLLSLYEVNFSSGEPGSAFVFTSTGF